LGSKIPIRNRIHAVLADRFKSKLVGQYLAINWETRSGYSPAAKRQNTGLFLHLVKLF
jgi:hypothetical protein